MKCFYCGKRETYRNPFYNLDKDGNKICQSCMREGHTKYALEIIEHNKQVDMRKEDEGEMKTFEDNEIIKAVECCIGNTKCGECPMFRTPNCMNKVFGYALDLINRKDTKISELEAEIEKLNTILPKNKDTIVILPCEVGTRIYQVIDEYDAKRNGCSRCLADFGFKTECAYYKNKDCTNLTANKHWQIISRRFELKDKDLFGEMIFLTHTEAETKLQEINARYDHPTEKGGAE